MKNILETLFLKMTILLFSIKSEKNNTQKENITGINFDYSDEILSVYFEVADKRLAKDILFEIDFIKNIKELKHGFTLDICAQQIPEIISQLLAVNITIYAVIPQKE